MIIKCPAKIFDYFYLFFKYKEAEYSVLILGTDIIFVEAPLVIGNTLHEIDIEMTEELFQNLSSNDLTIRQIALHIIVNSPKIAIKNGIEKIDNNIISHLLNEEK